MNTCSVSWQMNFLSAHLPTGVGGVGHNGLRCCRELFSTGCGKACIVSYEQEKYLRS